jgi:hypothetical protein
VSTTTIGILAGVSTVFGLLSVLGFFLVQIQKSPAEQSVRRIVEGDSLFDADRVVQILRQFTDDKLRLDALTVLAHYDRRKAEELLSKVKSNVDLQQLNISSLRHQRGVLLIAGLVLLSLGAFGLIYSSQQAKQVKPPEGTPTESRETAPPAARTEPAAETAPEAGRSPRAPLNYVSPESSAKEIMATIEGAGPPSWKQVNAAKNLFEGRWLRPPGLRIRVSELPQPSLKGCDVIAIELGTGAEILVKGAEAGCALRSGDERQLEGKIVAATIRMITIAEASFGKVFPQVSNDPSKAALGSWARVATIHAPGARTWGQWSELAWCEKGTFAVGFRAKIEGKQGDGQSDDTAMNAVELACRDPINAQGAQLNISAAQGQWGEFTPWVSCATGSVLASYTLKSEPDAQNDDTAANGIRFGCRSLTSDEAATIPNLRVSNEGYWGSFGQEAHCPARSGICALKTRVQASQGRGVSRGHDDTALNDVQFECCGF